MSSRRQKSARHQRQLRRRRFERAFLFDQDLGRCLGEVEREEWELALSIHGGNVADAAIQCGLPGIPRGAKALWGASAEQALGTYRSWQKKKKKGGG